jgi:hypothetical protein
MQTTPALSPATQPYSSAVAPAARYAKTGLLDPEPAIHDRSRAASYGSMAAPRRLGELDRPATLEHFLRLSEADRHMRFLQVMPDHTIHAYAAQIEFSKAICFGVFDAEDRLVAFAEAMAYRAGAHLICHRKNAPMRGLLRAIDAVTNFDDCDLEAEWDLTL